MPLYALDDLGDALSATRELLTPLRVGTWLKLAVVVLFLGGVGGNTSPVSFSTGGDGGVTPPDVEPGIDPGVAVGLVALVSLVVALVVFAVLVVSGVMEFVFVESLRSREVRIRRYWRDRWRQGVRLALFRFGLGVVLLSMLAAVVALAVVPFVAGEAGPLAAAFLVVLVPVFGLTALLFGLVDGFTRAFVVPVMVVADCNVLAGWRRFWPSVAGNPGQYLAYLVVVFVLTLVVGFVVGLLAVLVGLLLLVPFSIPFLAGVVLVEGSPAVGAAVLVVTGIAFGVTFAVGLAVVRVPFATFYRYYSLLLLGDVSPELDPVAEVRAAIRGDGGAVDGEGEAADRGDRAGDRGGEDGDHEPGEPGVASDETGRDDRGDDGDPPAGPYV